MFNCFKKKELKEIPAVKFGVIISHTALKQGARNSDGVTEYGYACEMAGYLMKDILYSFRDFDGVRGAASTLFNMGCNASCEPHLNAFNKKAEGFEILILKGDKESEYYAQEFVEKFRTSYPNRKIRQKNGIKYISKGDRGYYNLRTAKKNGMRVALLTEAFFLDNPKEWIEPEEMAGYFNSLLY